MDAGPDGAALERSLSWQTALNNTPKVERISALATPPRSRIETANDRTLKPAPGPQPPLPSVIRKFDPPAELFFVDIPLDERYICVVCEKVLRYPVQFEECKHRCCSACVTNLVKVEARCAKDQCKIDKNKIKLDKLFQKEIDCLQVFCGFNERGCEWRSMLIELSLHMRECTYRLITCKKCNVSFEQRFLEGHEKNDCTKRIVECERGCGMGIVFDEKVNDNHDCPKEPIPCPNDCQMVIPRDEIDIHLNEECELEEIDCYLACIGCEFRDLRGNIDKHLEDEFDKHYELSAKLLSLHKKQLTSQSEKLSSTITHLCEITNRCTTLEKSYGSQLIWKIEDYSKKLKDAITRAKPTIYSPPFLTSRHGYRLSISTSLYGDGKAYGTHMSIFICICKGEYDSLLKWPFTHRITFTLLYQGYQDNNDVDEENDGGDGGGNKNKKNITFSIKPKPNAENLSFLSEPKAERNASFGAQKFVELHKLQTQDFIRDGSIYIKVEVDSEDIPLL